MNNNAKFAFLYVLSAIALVFVAVSVGLVAFFVVDKEIVDILAGRRSSSGSSLKFAVSALIIATPIFYLSAHQIYRNLKSGALEIESGIRKWLTYFILLVSSVVMLGWMVSLINGFLDGELSGRFIAKALVAIIIALIIFIFYFYDIRREKIDKKNSRFLKVYSWVVLAVVLGVFMTGILSLELPKNARAERIDQLILNNVYMLETSIQTYYFNNDILPNDLDTLKKESNIVLYEESYMNPVTQKELVYNVVGEKKYELCTDFRTSNIGDSDYQGPIYERHDVGYQCLQFGVSVPNKLSL